MNFDVHNVFPSSFQIVLIVFPMFSHQVFKLFSSCSQCFPIKFSNCSHCVPNVIPSSFQIVLIMFPMCFEDVSNSTTCPKLNSCNLCIGPRGSRYFYNSILGVQTSCWWSAESFRICFGDGPINVTHSPKEKKKEKKTLRCTAQLINRTNKYT